ncbi:hypothetical protein D3C81_690950 [compost metagenome]
MPFAGRHHDRISIIGHSLIIQLIFAIPHLNESLAFFDPDKLIRIRMNLQTNIISHIDAHQGHLEMLPRPYSGAVVVVLLRSLFNINDVRARSIVFDSFRKSYRCIPSHGSIERQWRNYGLISCTLIIIRDHIRAIRIRVYRIRVPTRVVEHVFHSLHHLYISICPYVKKVTA